MKKKMVLLDGSDVENRRELGILNFSTQVYQRRQWEITLIIVSQNIAVERNLKPKKVPSSELFDEQVT